MGGAICYDIRSAQCSLGCIPLVMAVRRGIVHSRVHRHPDDKELFLSLDSAGTKVHILALKFPSPFSDTFDMTVAYYLTDGLSPSL